MTSQSRYRIHDGDGTHRCRSGKSGRTMTARSTQATTDWPRCTWNHRSSLEHVWHVARSVEPTEPAGTATTNSLRWHAVRAGINPDEPCTRRPTSTARWKVRVRQLRTHTWPAWTLTSAICGMMPDVAEAVVWAIPKHRWGVFEGSTGNCQGWCACGFWSQVSLSLGFVAERMEEHILGADRRSNFDMGVHLRRIDRLQEDDTGNPDFEGAHLPRPHGDHRWETGSTPLPKEQILGWM